MSKLSLRLKANRAKKQRCKNLIAVLENPKTIENVGSTIRNVDALGADKLYVVDGYNILGTDTDWKKMRDRRTLNKISASAIRWTFVRKFSNATDCLNHLQRKKFLSLVTSPHTKGKENNVLETTDFTKPRVAVWFGNESQGISDEVVKASVACIQIPMCGIIESLNLGTSTGIVLYEATRQRRAYLERKNDKQKKKKTATST